MALPVQLKMVGLVVEDMARSLGFYRKVGLEIPEGAEEQPHVEVEIGGGVVLFWDSAFVGAYDPDREKPEGGYRILPEFFLEGEEAVDAKYRELTGLGYRGHRAPFTTPFASRLAMVDDPDGNTVLLSAG